MTRVKMLVSMTGRLNGKLWPALGEECDVPEVVAESLIANEQAERVGAAKSETSSVDPVAEVASKPSAKARKISKD